jgi:predicted RNase H-like HicB family nuclease
MTELFFLIEEAPEGGWTARALGESIFTEGDSLDELKVNIKEAVACHFDDENRPKLLRLHIVKDELLTL